MPRRPTRTDDQDSPAKKQRSKIGVVFFAFFCYLSPRMTAYLPPLIILTGFSSFLSGCTTQPNLAPAPTTYHSDASGRYSGRDEVHTNAATGKPEVMHYDAKGRYIGISR